MASGEVINGQSQNGLLELAYTESVYKAGLPATLRRLRKEDLQLKANPGYIVKLPRINIHSLPRPIRFFRAL